MGENDTVDVITTDSMEQSTGEMYISTSSKVLVLEYSNQTKNLGPMVIFLSEPFEENLSECIKHLDRNIFPSYRICKLQNLIQSAREDFDIASVSNLSTCTFQLKDTQETP